MGHKTLGGPGASLLRWWGRLQGKPLGKWLFSRLVGRMAPYTGTIKARIEHIAPGHCRATMRDRRGLRNHLRSVHAIALANLGEVVSGLAMLAGLPEDARGIVAGLEIAYLKKARGTLVAECHCAPPVSSARQELPVTAEIRDASGELVTTVTATWLIGPKGETGGAAAAPAA